MFKIIRSAFSSYVAKNEQKHLDIKESSEKITNTWVKVKNDFPEEIKQLLTNAKSKSGSNLVLLNDDHTPMEYAVFVLEGLFGMDKKTSSKKMLEVHEKGSIIVVDSIESEVANNLVFYLRGHANSRGYLLRWEIQNA